MSEALAPVQVITAEAVPKPEAVSPEKATHLGSRVVAEIIDISWLSNAEKDKPFVPNFEKLFDGLDKYTGVLSNADSRLRLLQDASPTTLLEGFDELHALMTPEEVHATLDRPAVVGRNIKNSRNNSPAEHVTSQIFIDPSDREEFIGYVHQKLGEVRDVDMAADVISFAVLNLHMYPDGNGRTARLLHFLAKEGYDGSEEAKQHIKDFAMPRDAVEGPRPISFNVENVLKQALLDGLVDKTQQKEIRQKFELAAAIDDKYDSKQISASILGNSLSGINDENLRNRLVKVLQQSDFGDAAMENIIEDTEKNSDFSTIDTFMRLGSITDVQAVQIINTDRQTRLAYMKQVIDIAAGGKVAVTNKYTGEVEEIGADGLTMSTEWQAKYLAVA